jgi:hypothetical protein
MRQGWKPAGSKPSTGSINDSPSREGTPKHLEKKPTDHHEEAGNRRSRESLNWSTVLAVSLQLARDMARPNSEEYDSSKLHNRFFVVPFSVHADDAVSGMGAAPRFFRR